MSVFLQILQASVRRPHKPEFLGLKGLPGREPRAPDQPRASCQRPEPGPWCIQPRYPNKVERVLRGKRGHDSGPEPTLGTRPRLGHKSLNVTMEPTLGRWAWNTGSRGGPCADMALPSVEEQGGLLPSGEQLELQSSRTCRDLPTAEGLQFGSWRKLEKLKENA